MSIQLALIGLAAAGQAAESAAAGLSVAWPFALSVGMFLAAMGCGMVARLTPPGGSRGPLHIAAGLYVTLGVASVVTSYASQFGPWLHAGLAVVGIAIGVSAVLDRVKPLEDWLGMAWPGFAAALAFCQSMTYFLAWVT